MHVKMVFNKKGQYDVTRFTFYWIIAGILLTMAIFASAIVISSYQSKVLEIPGELEAQLITLRLVNNADCFAFEDLAGHVVQSSIDMDKFTQERLDDCYFPGGKQGFRDITFGLELEEESLRTENYFEVISFTLREEVLIYEGGEVRAGTLLAQIQEYWG